MCWANTREALSSVSLQERKYCEFSSPWWTLQHPAGALRAVDWLRDAWNWGCLDSELKTSQAALDGHHLTFLINTEQEQQVSSCNDFQSPAAGANLPLQETRASGVCLSPQDPLVFNTREREMWQRQQEHVVPSVHPPPLPQHRTCWVASASRCWFSLLLVENVSPS